MLDERDVADRRIPVERDERNRNLFTAALAPQLAAPEIEPLPIVETTVLLAVPARQRLDVLRMIGKQLDRDRHGSRG